MDKNKEICKQLIALSIAMGFDQKPERIKYYANELEEFDLIKIIHAIKKISRSSRFFPQLGEIIDSINGTDIPTDELANIWAKEIVNTFYRCASEAEAELTLGEKYQVLVMAGGWREFSSTKDLNQGMATAQIRDLAKAYINRSKGDAQESGEGFVLDTSPRSISVEKKKSGLKLITF